MITLLPPAEPVLQLCPNPPSPSLIDEQGDIPTLRNQDISILRQYP
jgi:hypothetical protein